MKKKLIKVAKRHLKEIRQRHDWQKVVFALACVVVFCTTYAMILPAVTLEKNSCGLEEHSHGESCYEKVLSKTVQTLACGYDSEDAHVHAAECFDAEGNPTCGKTEESVHIHEEEACYVTEEVPADDADLLTCPLSEGHVHAENCCDEAGILICEETENHIHGDMCYGTWVLVCGQEEHTHTDQCRAQEELRGELETVVTEPADPGEQIAPMALAPKDYLVEPTQIDGSNVTWEVSLNEVGEYVLYFDGVGAIPDYPGNSPDRAWYNYLNSIGSPRVRLEFGQNVTAVGQNSMQRIYISSIVWGGIEEIRAYGFSYGGGPEILEISGTVKRIQDSAFYARSGIKGFNLHEGIEYLGHSCFSCYVDGDITLHIPASVTSIPSTLNVSVAAFTVAEDNQNYCAVDGVLFSKDMKILMSYPPQKQADIYRIPDGVETTRPYAFAGVVRIGQLVVSPDVKLMQFYMVQNGYIREVYFEDGSKLNSTGNVMWNKAGLTNIRYPENTEIPLASLFKDVGAAALDRYTHFTVPNKITSIGYMAGTLRNLETLTYNAENANITTEKLFSSSAPYDLIVGDQVNHLPKNFSCFVTPSGAVYFRGENTFTVESGAFTGAEESLENLYGKFYVDKSGILYQCMDGGGAKVVYASRDVPAELTIPASIQTDDGAIYQVTAVGGNAFRSAEKLTNLTFAEPSKITDLAPYAMASCPTLESVNGKTTKGEAEAIFPENIQKTNLFINTGLDRYTGDQDSDGILDGIGQENLTVKRTGATDMDILLRSGGGTMQWVENENGNGLYKLLTGDTMIVTAAVGNTEGKEDFVYRIYVRKTGEKGALDIIPGQTYTFDGQTAVCCATEDPYAVYLEFQPTVGSTVSVPINMVYPSPGSAGGGMEIWGVIQSGQEAERTANALVAYDEIIQIQWTTEPDDFELIKIGSSKLNIISDGNGKGKPSANLYWKIEMQRNTETTSSYGKDYVKSVVFTDTITLPEGFSWNKELEQALKSGTVRYIANTMYVGNEQFANISESTTSAPIKQAEAYWDNEKDTLAFRWEMTNGNVAEMNASTVTVTVFSSAISIDMDKVDTSLTHTILNNVMADVRYHYGDSVQLSASAGNTVSGGSARLVMSKTSSGPLYFGQDVTYTVDLYNSGAVPYVGQEGKAFTVDDKMSKYSYIKPENMEKMFQLYGADLVIEISDAVLVSWQSVTGVDGTTAWLNSGNSDLGSEGHKVVITAPQTGEYQVSVDGKVSAENTSLETALKNVGYAVTESATYKCTWKLNNSGETFTLDTNEHILFYVYGTVKDSFRIISKDWPTSYPSTEKVNVVNEVRLYRGSSQQAYASKSDKVKREAYVRKSAYKGNQEQYDGGSVVDGDVLTYHLDFYHYGTGSYENLPMVDDLYGSQYLLVPAEENPQLAGLDTHEDQGVVYYILKAEDSDDPNHVTLYENVTVGMDDEGNSLVAATVTVGRATDEVQVELGGNTVTYAGIHTEIKWYFPEKSGEYWMQVRYKALVDMSQSGITYTIGNAVWMNDRRNTRIYDFIWGGGTIIEFEKEIVTEKGDTYAADVTEKYSLVPPGGEVLYRLTLHNTDNAPFTLKCENLADGLPENFGIFPWDRTNVTLTGIETDSETLEYTGLDQWDIADSFGGMAGENRQYIVWPEGAEIRFKDSSTIYLYFTLTYPDNGGTELWNQYAAAVSGNRIFNTLYVYKFSSSVEHDLYEPGKVLLQKGVSGMYYYGTTHPDFTYHVSGNSRQYYNNQDLKKRAVMYYVMLCNGGNKRLYLDDLYDRLPEGFFFAEMSGSSPVGKGAGSSYTSLVTAGGVLPDGNGLTAYSGGTIVYRSATVKPEATDNGVRFRISAGTGDYAVRYNQEKGKYYLNSGEAIAFGYICDTGTAASTEDLATNTIAMAYDDYLGTGLTTVPVSEFPVSAVNIEPFQDNNDGTRLVKSDQEVVDQYGFPSGGETQWLVSDVTLERGRIRPGVTKYTDAYTPEGGNRQEYRYAVVPTATVHWRVRLHNSGTMVLWDYTFTDVMPKPYVFEGDIVFQCYDINDHMYYEQALGTISQRSPGDTSLTFVKTDGTKITVPLDGTQVKVGTNRLLSIEKDETGNEVLRIECKAGDPSIQEGGYMDVTLSSRNPTNDHTNTVYTNRATLHPKTQQFDNVGQGSMLRDEQGAPVGAENYSPVNVSFGYATRSEKRVTEDARPENTAVSVDMDKNRIYLGSAEDTFTYQLTVGNDTEIPMTKLVIIDNLPEPGDHTPFDSSVSRGSAFTVHFAEDPDFTVRITGKEGEQTVLTPDQYTLEFSDSTDFGGPQSSDWNGADTGKWYGQPTAASRSLRLIILDDSGTLIPHESQIDITFRAKADPGAEAGMIAWNSFGYHYGLQGISGELEAMPLVVGVAVPDVPALKKQIVSADSDVPAKVQVRSEFRFLIYEGAALSGTYTSGEELRAALDAAGRPDDAVAEVTVPVDAGQAESAELPLESMPWKWIHGNKYTVSEIPSGDKFSFYRFEGGHNTQYTFTYDTGYTQTVVCKNRLEEWSIRITKTDPEGRLLAGAVFGLYSPSAENMMSQEEAALWDAPLTAEVETEEGKQIWYLQKVAETGKDGVVLWRNLLEERYYLLEIHAPDGHNLPEKNGWMLERSESESGVLDVQGINEPGYELPETGGMGTTMFYIFGSVMMLAAFALLVTKKRMADAV